MNEHPPAEPAAPLPQPVSIRLVFPASQPYVTYGLLVVTILVYLLQAAGQLLRYDLVTMLGKKDNLPILSGQLWRLITPVFLHGSILHLGFNMYVLFLRGREVEAIFGHWRFLWLYFLSAFAGNVFSFLFNPSAALGASTAIFGLFAAEAVFILQNRKILGRGADSALRSLLSLIGINLLLGFILLNVDNWGHLGGLLGGLLFTWLGGPRWKIEGMYPVFQLVDERQSHGALTGALVVLLVFSALAALGWI